MVLVLGGSSVVLVRLVVLALPWMVLDGAGWVCLAMPRWRGGSGAGAGADVVTLIVLVLSELVQMWGGDKDGAGGWSWALYCAVDCMCYVADTSR